MATADTTREAALLFSPICTKHSTCKGTQAWQLPATVHERPVTGGFLEEAGQCWGGTLMLPLPRKPFACVCAVSLQVCQTLWALWTVAHQAPLSMGFSRQEYWGGWPCPPPEDLPHPGIELESLMSPALAFGFSTTEQPKTFQYCLVLNHEQGRDYLILCRF